MKISVVLFKSKTLADGTHPVMLRFSHKDKMKYISTGQSSRYWSKTTNRIGSKDPNYEAKNRVIDEMYLKYKNRLADIEREGIEPTFELLLSEQAIVNGDADKSNYINIIQEKSDSCTAHRTKKEYLTFKKVMIELYGDYIDVNEINQGWVDEFRRKIDEYYGSHNSQKNHCIKCIVYGAYTFAIEREYVKFPKRLKCKDFVHIKGQTDLSNEEITNIIRNYKKNMCALKDFLSEEQQIALGTFILMMAFQGISNIEIAQLKVKDLTFKTVKKLDVDLERYYNNSVYRERIDAEQEVKEIVVVNAKRQKTHIPFVINCEKTIITPLLEIFYDGKDGEEYLLPCLSSEIEGNEAKTIVRVANWFTTNAKVLRECMNWFCDTFNEARIRKLTYYMARHAFINRLNDLNVPHNLIQKFIGHKEGVLQSSYITPPTEWECAEITSMIFNQGETIESLIKNRP